MARTAFSRRWLLAGASAGALALCAASASRALGARAGPEEISVFAAASLADALTEVGRTWEKASGYRAVFNFGASSDLSRQIRSGAPADVFFSADSTQMDALEREGLVRATDRQDLLSNTLVVIVPAASSATVAGPRDLAAFKTIAVADPQAVPAGVYARRWLEGLGLWTELAPRVVPTLHVRAERTSSGKDITAIASTTAFQVKTTSSPWLASQPPSGERLPSASSSTRPTAVGGSTRGSDSSVSSAPLPGPR